MILAALLLAALPQAAPPGPAGGEILAEGTTSVPALPPISVLAPARDPLTPETVLDIPGGPRVARLGTPGSEVVAIRLSVPMDEALDEAGAGRILQLLGVERVQGQARTAGVTFEGTRTPWGIAYTAVGTRSDFDLLAYLIREAVAEPEGGEFAFERHRIALRSEVLRTHETPGARVVSELRAKAAPAMPPLEGTPASLDRLTRAALRSLWARTHRAAAMTLVVAGEVPDELLLSAFRDLGAPAGARGEGSSGSAARGDARGTQVLRHWYGEAFPIEDPRDPHASVAALLISDQLRGSADALEADVQLWELDGIKVIAVVAAAYPAAATRMRNRIRGLAAETRRDLTGDAVEHAVARVRQDMLQRARSQAGLVTLVGRHFEATGDLEGARAYVDALDRVTLSSARAFVGRLEADTPLRAEVRP